MLPGKQIYKGEFGSEVREIKGYQVVRSVLYGGVLQFDVWELADDHQTVHVDDAGVMWGKVTSKRMPEVLRELPAMLQPGVWNEDRLAAAHSWYSMREQMAAAIIRMAFPETVGTEHTHGAVFMARPSQVG